MQSGRVERAVKVCAIEYVHVLAQSQRQTAELMSTLEVDQMRDGILVRVIDVQNYTRHVIQTDIVAPAPFDVAEPDRNRRLNREIVIGYPVRITDKDVVVVNPPNGQPQTVVKAARFG